MNGAALRLSQKVEGAWHPLHFRGCHPRGHVQASLGRDQLTGLLYVLLVGGHLQASLDRDELTDLHCVSVVGGSRVSHGEGGLASFLPKLDAIVEAGFCLCFTSFSEEVFIV